jgi:3',5'-cyclic AMP phosphodiesterase CpdA
MAMLSFAQLTDLHLLPPGERIYGRDPAENLRAAVADIAARHAKDGPAPLDCAVLTGDLSHHGTPEAYRLLKDCLAALPCPAYCLLGNHDDRAIFRQVFPEAAADAHGFIQQAVPTPLGRLLLLDTHEPGTVKGRLCARRLGWLAERLAEADDPVFLFMHHTPARIGIPPLDNVGLIDAEAFWEVIAPHRARIRHLFHGHVHRPLGGSWRGIPLSCPRALAPQQFALTFTPAPKATGIREPAAYAYVRATAEEVVVHIHDFAGGYETFPL